MKKQTFDNLMLLSVPASSIVALVIGFAAHINEADGAMWMLGSLMVSLSAFCVAGMLSQGVVGERG